MAEEFETLATRKGLPEALRVLLEELPRAGWEAHPNYSQLIAFWLDRHLMFRALLERLEQTGQAALDRRADPRWTQAEVSRFGGMLINELHGHHRIEDLHYFPVLARVDSGVSRGFDLLDRDHHALDGILSDMADGANAVLRSGGGDAGFRDRVADFRAQLTAFAPMLDRHLVDEEELIVPVLLKHAPEEFR